MNSLYIILALIPLAVVFRYLLEQTQAARVIGMKMASPEFLAMKKTGFQDAISVPEAGKWFFIVLTLLVAGLAWLALDFGWRPALSGFFIAWGAPILAQVLFLPSRHSRHFLMQTFASLSRRYADYERDGDTERAKATAHMLALFSLHYGEVVMNQKR